MTKIPNVDKQDLPAKAAEIFSKDNGNAVRYHERGQRHFITVETSFGFRISDLFRVPSLGFTVFPL